VIVLANAEQETSSTKIEKIEAKSSFPLLLEFSNVHLPLVLGIFKNTEPRIVNKINV